MIKKIKSFLFVFNVSERGFSLIEVTISLVIIFVAFELCLIEVQLFQISRGQRSEGIAYQVANKQMESLRATPFESLPSSGTVSDTLLSQIPSGAGSYATSDYSGYEGVKELVVTVTWDDGLSKSIVLKTLAQDGGFNP